MSKEFRVVIDEKDVSKINPDASKGIDFTDYYLERTKRIRNFPVNHEWFLITTEPGMIEKNKEEISEAEAKPQLLASRIIVKKEGLGLVNVGGIEGYMERVIAMKPGNDTPLLNEVHIEFETDFDKISIIKDKINPTKVIEVGLFDYISGNK